jgi:2-methylcitrate dehydratase PrpD
MEQHQIVNSFAQWAARLTFADLPTDVVEHAKNQVISILAAALAGYQSQQGRQLAAATRTPSSAEPLQAAFRLSSWSMIFDFDDVMLGGHTGHSSVVVPLILALAHGGSGMDIIVAQVAANEIAARLNIACALGQTRGQMASHLHLIAAAVARAKFEGLDAAGIADALAFALSSPGRLLMPAFLGSDAKFFCAAWPLRVGWEAVDCVRAGLRPNLDAVDGPLGFLAGGAEAAGSALLAGLGDEWMTLTNSYKPYPVCGYLNSAVDAALELARRHDLDPAAIAAVNIEANLFVYGVDRYARRYWRGPESTVATLSFSPAFVVASSLVFRELQPSNYAEPRLCDDRVWQLAARVKLSHSLRQTQRALFSGIPVGVVLSNARWPVAYGFLRDFVKTVLGRTSWLHRTLYLWPLFACWCLAPRQSQRRLHELKKPLGTRIEIRLHSGKHFTAEREIPIGFAGDGDWHRIRQLMAEKFRMCAEALLDATATATTWSLLNTLERLSAKDLQAIDPLVFLSSEGH